MNKPFSLAVKAAVHNGRNAWLFIRRSPESKHFAGKWDLPGGKVDPGETFVCALLREALEETGLSITLEDVVGAARDEMEKVNVVLLCMAARAGEGDVRLSDEHDAYRWVPADQIETVDISGQLRPLVPMIMAAANAAAGGGDG